MMVFLVEFVVSTSQISLCETESPNLLTENRKITTNQQQFLTTQKNRISHEGAYIFHFERTSTFAIQ